MQVSFGDSRGTTLEQVIHVCKPPIAVHRRGYSVPRRDVLRSSLRALVGTSSLVTASQGLDGGSGWVSSRSPDRDLLHS